MRAIGFGVLVSAAFLSACEGEPTHNMNGYIEGEYVYVGAPDGGWVTQVLVSRGTQVKIGDSLFLLDAQAQLAQRDQAAAQLAQAAAQLEDAKKGRRTEEIAALESAVGSAKANLALAERELQRTDDLLKRGFASQATYDAKRAQRDVALAQVKEAEANLRLGRKGARQDEIRAAEANVQAAKAALERAEYALSQRTIRSKVAGRVEDTLRRAGEFAPPGGAVISLLPAQNIKVRFFVPERVRSKLSLGTIVAITCDSCARDLTARVSFISNTAEFTPPVIYSIESREKLVWMVEAVPANVGALSPGQPVDVKLP